jgi:hypothetical protein
MRKHILPCLASLILLPGATQLSEAAVATFKEGAPAPFGGGSYAGTDDVVLVSNNAGQQDQNFGAREDFAAGEGSTQNVLPRHSLMRFDVTSMAGQYSLINSVTLRLYPTGVDFDAGLGPDNLQVFRLSNANTTWVEGTGFTAAGGDPPDNGQTTWSQRVQGLQNWAGSPGASSAGADYTTPLGQTAFSSSTTPGVAFDITFDPSQVQTLINDWSSGNNAGLFLRSQLELNRLITFNSAEAASAALRPELIVNYVVPEPASIGICMASAMLILSPRRRTARFRGLELKGRHGQPESPREPT